MAHKVSQLASAVWQFEGAWSSTAAVFFSVCLSIGNRQWEHTDTNWDHLSLSVCLFFSFARQSAFFLSSLWTHHVKILALWALASNSLWSAAIEEEEGTERETVSSRRRMCAIIKLSKLTAKRSRVEVGYKSWCLPKNEPLSVHYGESDLFREKGRRCLCPV